jgi:2-polyprenyl-6-methoxyphenol hydroxylase-like FAD-dependent oxidoreductase
MILGYLLARPGVPVTVLEKHADFLRDFRGDTVHPSTLQVLDELGLLPAFERLPQRRIERLGAQIGGRLQQVIEFRGLKPFGYLALVPQWDFLDFIAGEARRRYPHFDLRMRHEATGLVERSGRVAGVSVRSPEGDYEILADVVVACDGRDSRLREAAGLRAVEFGAPMDVLWFRLPREESDPEDTFAIIDAGHMMIMLNRTDYWQSAYVVPKGGDLRLRARPIGELRESVAQLVPFLGERTGELASWDAVKTLEVHVNRLEQWYRPGLLLIGDAAHAMSPVGGVGINLAIQDAVAAANALAPSLRAPGPVGEAPLRAVQKRRLLPTRLTQAVQLQIQKRVIAAVLSSRTPQIPALMRWLLRFPAVRRIPARVMGYGFRREKIGEK